MFLGKKSAGRYNNASPSPIIAPGPMNTLHPSDKTSPDILPVPAGDLGDLAGELDAVANGSFVADLSNYALLAFSGEDALSFLQNQMSCDVDALAGKAVSSYGSYSTAKGRMLANFLLWQEGEEWRMILHRSIAPAIQKRLGMFVLRAKVTIADRSSETALMGTGGPAAVGALRTLTGAVPLNARQLHSGDGTTLIALPGGRWLLTVDKGRAESVRTALNGVLRSVGASAWNLTEIRNGIPWVTVKTQDQFVPQMANLELIGGVSFKKGCYPGQEIVARTQYLGKLKRRLYLAHVEASAHEGDELCSEDVGGQVNGMIANAAPAPGGGSNVLAVVQSSSMENDCVHFKSTEGPKLRFLSLPYPLPETGKP
jgi:folate-binding protein YgfZ